MKKLFFNMWAWLWKHKRTAVGVIIALVVIVVVGNLLGGSKPKNYEDAVKTVLKGMGSKSSVEKMDKALEKYIDLRGAVAWQNAGHDSKKLNKEYRKVKKDSDDVDDMKEALELYAEDEQDDEGIEVKNIKKPVKSKKNSKVYTVRATIVYNDSYLGDWENDYKVVFYKGKIIDVLECEDEDYEESMFEYILDFES